MKRKKSDKVTIIRTAAFLCALICLFFLLHVRVLGEEIDAIPPTINVEITDAEKEFTSKVRKAIVTISDNKMVGEIKKEYVFKEGKDSFHISIKDAAGNESTYKSEVYIQDYTAPKIRIVGIKDAQIINGELKVNIYAEDEWLDGKKSFVKIKGQKSFDEYVFYYTENRINIYGDSFRDDYYTMTVFLSDMAGNVSEQKISFMINRKGSAFDIDENNKRIIGTVTEEIKDFTITEKNLSKVDIENARILFAANARVIELKNSTDYYVEERKDETGYTYTYIFSNDLFVKDGVYTISISTTDEAGNVNDTRFNKDTDEIRFAVKKGLEASYKK